MSAGVILLGSGGALGSCLRTQLAGTDGLLSPRSSDLDLLNTAAVRAYLGAHSSERTVVILNAARMPYTVEPHDDPAGMAANVMMAANVASGLSGKPPRKIVFVSSIDVYGKADGVVTEESQPHPVTNYALSKRYSELVLERYAASTGIALLVCRVTHLFGPGDRSPKLIPSLIQSALDGGRMMLQGSVSLRRDLLSFADASRYLCEGALGSQTGLFNLASGVSRTALEIAQTVRSVVGPAAGIEFAPGGKAALDYSFDIARLNASFRSRPGDFEAQMRETVEFFRNKQ